MLRCIRNSLFSAGVGRLLVSHLNGNGACELPCELLLRLLGPHTVEVTYDDVPVSNSPFKVDVTEGCHPSRVLAQGAGLKEAFTNKPNPFTVVTR